MAVHQYRKMFLLWLACALPGAGQLVTANSLVDPTRPAHFRALESGFLQRIQAQYTLNSVIYGAQRQVAIINGQSVSVGERIGEAKIAAIRKTGVTLIVQDRQFELELAAGQIKKWR